MAGFIHPGDNVDVIVTMKPRDDGESPTVSKIILQNIHVLAVGKELDPRPNGTSRRRIPATVATLMVDSEESERLALAATKGQILLALRSRLDLGGRRHATGSPRRCCSPAPPRPRRAVAASKPPAPRAPQAAPAPAPRRRRDRPRARAEQKQVVEILRGDLFEKRDFQKEASR